MDVRALTSLNGSAWRWLTPEDLDELQAKVDSRWPTRREPLRTGSRNRRRIGAMRGERLRPSRSR